MHVSRHVVGKEDRRKRQVHNYAFTKQLDKNTSTYGSKKDTAHITLVQSCAAQSSSSYVVNEAGKTQKYTYVHCSPLSVAL